MRYTLNPTEQRIARHLAAGRHAAGQQVRNARMGPQGDAEIHLEGIGAELAFCRLFNVYPDFSIGARCGGTDATWVGRTVDVKATRHEGGRLIAVLKKADYPCDLYALMVGTFPTYRFAGMASRAQLLAAEAVTDLGYGPTFALAQDQLTRVEP